MYVSLLSCIVLILRLLPPVVSISSPGALTREVGQDVVFMFNASNTILGFSWGIRDGNTNNLKQGLVYYDTQVGMKLDDKINSSSYVGRVSFVGDLSKNQAWFKITNLNINDTNQYLLKIFTQGSSGYTYLPVRLTLVMPLTTTKPYQTSTATSTSVVSSTILSKARNATPTTSSELSNQSLSIKVVREVRGDLHDPNSAAFRNFSRKFISEVNSVYKTIENFENAKVTSLSENSIPVKFVVYFKSTTKPDEICAPLREAVNDNRLGSLNIVPGSLGCSKEPNQDFPKNQSSPACQCTSITAACVTVIILLILAVMALIIYIWRSRSSNTRKGAGNSRSIQEKGLETYENVHPMENTSEAMTTRTERTPKNEKELYETINERGNKVTTASAKPVRGDSPSTQHEAHSLPQHYQELQRKTPNAIPLYEPLDQRDGNNGKRTQGPNTYEQLQKNASGGEYQSLSNRYKGTESKV